MSLAKDLDTPKTTSGIIFPPSNLLSDEPPLETYRHLAQIIVLLTSLEWWWKDRNDFFAAGNLTIYYNLQQLRSRDFRGPDFFVVLNIERKERKSWVVWEENGKYPNLIIEILSETTAVTDRELKKQIYQDTFRTPDYFWFDLYTLEFAGFHLLDGQYQALAANPQGWLWSQQLGLYLGIHAEQLRFFTAEGHLVPTPTQAAQLAQQQAERMAAKLRELGVDPNAL